MPYVNCRSVESDAVEGDAGEHWESTGALWLRKGQGRNGWRGWRRSNAGEEKTNKEKKRPRKGDKQKMRQRDGLKMATKSRAICGYKDSSGFKSSHTVGTRVFLLCL